MVTDKAEVDLEAFVAHEYPAVVSAVGLITGDRQSADDAVQDAIVGYLANPPRKPVRNIAAWITVVASNRARDRLRRGSAESRALTKVGLPEESGSAVSEMLDVDVLAALDELPLQQRQVCVLHYLMDQPVATIAEGLGVSTGTIKTQLHRARKSLAAQLSKEDSHG